MNIIALIITTTSLLLGLVHLYWATGGEYGIDKAIPTFKGKPAIAPGPILTAIVGLALIGIGGISYLLGNEGLKSMAYANYVIYIGWFLSVVFIARAIGDFKLVGFFKKETTSEFARYDTRYYSPLCVALSAGFAYLAYSQT